jgi:hypothetical protein
MEKLLKIYQKISLGTEIAKKIEFIKFKPIGPDANKPNSDKQEILDKIK